MKHFGTIDVDKPVTVNGKPHGVEQIATLGAWTAEDIGRIVFETSSSKMWIGRNAGWEEVTEGHVGPHAHDDRYYSESEVDAFFSGKEGGKMVVDWNQVDNPPSEYAPSIHGDSAHSVAYITASAVSYTNLSANGSVGTGANQVALGSHNHDAAYATVSHDHSGTYAEYSHNHDIAYAALGHTHADYSLSVHNHDGSYAAYSHTHTLASLGAEPAIATKNTGFNLSLGTTAGTVAEGNHNHDTAYAVVGHDHNSLYSPLGHTHAEYALASHDHDAAYAEIGHTHTLASLGAEPAITKNTAFNVSFGTTAGTAAEGNHVHTAADVGAEPVITNKKTAFNVDFGSIAGTASEGSHTHSLASLGAEPAIVKNTAFNVNFGTDYAEAARGNHNHDTAYQMKVVSSSGAPVDQPEAGTIRFDSDGTKFYIYIDNTIGWKTGTFA